MRSFFILLLRKMLNGKWLSLCLLVGMITGAALLSSIPIYANGILQKLLLSDLQQYQIKNNAYPGSMNWNIDSFYLIKDGKDMVEKINNLSKKVKTTMPIPLLAQSMFLETSDLKLMKEDAEKEETNIGADKFFKLSALSGLEDHVSIIDGKMPQGMGSEGIYEGLLTEAALKEYDLTVGNILTGQDYLQDNARPIKVRIVGVIKPKTENDVFWYNGLSGYRTGIFVNYDLMRKEMFETGNLLPYKLSWYFAFDYNAIKLTDIDKIKATGNQIANMLEDSSRKICKYKFPVTTVFDNSIEKKSQMQILLLSMNTPVLVMLILFICIISTLKIEREKNKISMILSRGASKFQIAAVYAAEGFSYAALSMLLAPLAGLQLSRIIGASNGFLEFVDRTALDLTLDNRAYIYALCGVLLSVVLLVLLVLFSVESSVVIRKRSIMRNQTAPFWQRVYIDIILLAISIYGITVFYGRQHNLVVTGLKAIDFGIDPLLFIAPALFIIATGLLFLRLFPIIISIIYWLGKRLWGMEAYTVMIQIFRSIKQYHFIMLFIIFTISLGLFNANTARTINQNMEDRIKYNIGADIVVEPQWLDEASNSSLMNPGDANTVDAQPNYREPDFLQYEQLSGVALATKVYTTGDAKASSSKGLLTNLQLMGIDTEQFGKIALLREDLLGGHWYEYLNLIAREPSAVLISKSMADAVGLKPGDTADLLWGATGSATVTVFGIIDYWPSWNPIAKVQKEADGTEKIIYNPKPMLIVGNLQYIQENMSVEPYNIWIKLKPGATTQALYTDIIKRQLPVKTVSNLREELIKQKNDPIRLGINGVLTLGFIIPVMVCLIGFILFWSMSMGARELQFGIFRAMGLSKRQLISMLVLELVIISGSAIAAGIVIGSMVSAVFIPFFQITYSAFEQVPPFVIITNIMDHIKLLIVIAIMFAIGVAILVRLVFKVNISQALKLGED